MSERREGASGPNTPHKKLFILCILWLLLFWDSLASSRAHAPLLSYFSSPHYRLSHPQLHSLIRTSFSFPFLLLIHFWSSHMCSFVLVVHVRFLSICSTCTPPLHNVFCSSFATCLACFILFAAMLCHSFSQSPSSLHLFYYPLFYTSPAPRPPRPYPYPSHDPCFPTCSTCFDNPYSTATSESFPRFCFLSLSRPTTRHFPSISTLLPLSILLPPS